MYNYDTVYVYMEECATHCSSPSGTLKELGICWDKSTTSFMVDERILTQQNFITFANKIVVYSESPVYERFINERCNLVRRLFNQTGLMCVTENECCGSSRRDPLYLKMCPYFPTHYPYVCLCVKDSRYMPSHLLTNPKTCQEEDDANSSDY